MVLECLHSLRYSFNVHPGAAIRTISTFGEGVSVFASAPVGCGLDAEIADVSSLSTTLIDLTDLQTGVASDIDGTLTLPKQSGRNRRTAQPVRYKITEASFNIYT